MFKFFKLKIFTYFFSYIFDKLYLKKINSKHVLSLNCYKHFIYIYRDPEDLLLEPTDSYKQLELDKNKQNEDDGDKTDEQNFEKLVLQRNIKAQLKRFD